MKSRNPVALHSPEIASFNFYLKSLKSLLVGVNYVTHFEAKAFDLAGSGLRVGRIMLMAYPDSQPNAASIKQCSLDILLEVTNECLLYPDAEFMKNDIDRKVANDLCRKFWKHLRECIDYENADIHSYNSMVGLPGYDIFWNFAWLIHNKDQRRCVFVYGGSSD